MFFREQQSPPWLGSFENLVQKMDATVEEAPCFCNALQGLRMLPDKNGESHLLVSFEEWKHYVNTDLGCLAWFRAQGGGGPPGPGPPPEEDCRCSV